MRNRPPKATAVELNLAPMVDVMMCLLIFFMLATQLVQQENNRLIDLPAAQVAAQVEKQELGSRVVVNVQDAARLGGEGAVYVIQEEPVTLAAVLDRLKLESRVNAEVNCVIRADYSVAYVHVEAILVGCARAGIRNVTFSAIRGGGRVG